jgi:hypothetical protein
MAIAAWVVKSLELNERLVNAATKANGGERGQGIT